MSETKVLESPEVQMFVLIKITESQGWFSLWIVERAFSDIVLRSERSATCLDESKSE